MPGRLLALGTALVLSGCVSSARVTTEVVPLPPTPTQREFPCPAPPEEWPLPESLSHTDVLLGEARLGWERCWTRSTLVDRLWEERLE